MLDTDEDHYIEYKHFYYPIPEDKLFILRKAVIGFLNLFGGTILIGVHNNS